MKQATQKQTFQIQHNIVKNPNWQEADQLAIYKRDRGVELGATKKQLQLAVREEHEPGTLGLQVRHPNHSITLAPLWISPKIKKVKCESLYYKKIFRDETKQLLYWWRPHNSQDQLWQRN